MFMHPCPNIVEKNMHAHGNGVSNNRRTHASSNLVMKAKNRSFGITGIPGSLFQFSTLNHCYLIRVLPLVSISPSNKDEMLFYLKQTICHLIFHMDNHVFPTEMNVRNYQLGAGEKYLHIFF